MARNAFSSSASVKAEVAKLNGFEQCIKDYLDKYAASDSVFAAKYRSGRKTIQGCCRYIVAEARRRFMTGNNTAVMSDAEGFGLAVHYFDEDEIKESGQAPKSEVTVKRAAESKTVAAAKAVKAVKAESKPKTEVKAAPIIHMDTTPKASADDFDFFDF